MFLLASTARQLHPDPSRMLRTLRLWNRQKWMALETTGSTQRLQLEPRLAGTFQAGGCAAGPGISARAITRCLPSAQGRSSPWTSMLSSTVSNWHWHGSMSPWTRRKRTLRNLESCAAWTSEILLTCSHRSSTPADTTLLTRPESERLPYTQSSGTRWRATGGTTCCTRQRAGAIATAPPSPHRLSQRTPYPTGPHRSGQDLPIASPRSSSDGWWRPSRPLNSFKSEVH
mmetsp:Transcript_783/g.2504  ORF Transcript_783/g.2504 Transcript_783/m.2504 type:complete len:229 (+) Transcript_783:857-1543(+)